MLQTPGSVSRGLALLLVLLLAGVPFARAGEADFDAQLLEPSFANGALLASGGARPGTQWSHRVGLVLQYERAPLVLVRDETEMERLVSDRFGAWVGGWIALHERMGVGVVMPVYGHYGTFAGRYVKPVVPGDLRVDVKIMAVDLPVLAISGDLRLYLPTSARASFAGEVGPRLAPGLTVDLGPERAGFVAGLGLLFREKVETGFDLEVTHEFTLILGGRVELVSERLSLLGEFALRTALEHESSEGGQTPAELRLGLRARPTGLLALDLALGTGLGPGYGTSRVRVLLGITVLGPPKRPPKRRSPEPEPGPLLEARPSRPIDPSSDEDLPELPDVDPCAPDRRQVFLYDSFEADPDALPLLAEAEEVEEGPARVVEDRIVIRDPIPFRLDSDELLPEARPVLDAVRDLLDRRPDIGLLVIEGHASSEGTAAYNWDLSTRRAEAVFRYLVEAGIDPYRLAWRGMGEAVPTGGEDRRVEFRIERWRPADAPAPISGVPWREEER